MAGSITTPVPTILGLGNTIQTARSIELPISWTADASDGSVPTLAVTAYPGWMIIEALTNPGATAPTDNYDITLVDADAIDIAGGQLLNRDTTTSERVVLLDPPIIRSGGFTVTFAGNSVNSATGTLTLILVKVG